MKKYIRSVLSKIKFWAGANPVIEKCTDYKRYIPNGYQSVLTLTADFELAWGPRYSNNFNNPLKKAFVLAKRERKNIPQILNLCEFYNIPITWATVGHLFLNDCKRKNGIAHPGIPKVNPYIGPYWDFSGGDWFEHDPCSNYHEASEWYAPDLIEMILDSKVKHEIGCHTFSHIDCRNEVCSPVLFEAEILECKKAAVKYDLKLTSFVHPGHTIGNLDKLAELGFDSFQSDPGNILGFPVKHNNGLWELKRTYEFTYRKEWSVNYHIYRYKKIIDRAIKNHAVCNFWFHPSFDSKFVENILPEIFEYIHKKINELWIGTVGNYIRFLNNGDK